MQLSEARVGVLYPWAGFPSMDRGSARRLGPLISLLGSHCRSVEVLSPGNGPEFDQGGITFRYHRERPAEKVLVDTAFRLFDGITHYLWKGNVPVRERRQWWHYIQPRLLPSLKAAISELCGRSDLILMEYPFWVSVLPSEPPAPPFVLTLHDILSEGISLSWLRKRVLHEEVESCCRAAAIVCCNDADARFLRAHGFAPEIVPHGITLPSGSETSVAIPQNNLLKIIDSRHAEGALVCFFVGSSHQPNIEALDALSVIAAELRHDRRFLFVAAGSCCAPCVRAGNEIHLGPVTEAGLEQIYALCDIAMVPLINGTGASLKTIEALARKKVLLTTDVGARGYPLVSGREAIVLNNPKEFPAALRHLAENPDEQASLAVAGWEFIQAYDCNRVYQAYLPILSRLLSSVQKK